MENNTKVTVLVLAFLIVFCSIVAKKYSSRSAAFDAGHRSAFAVHISRAWPALQYARILQGF